MRITEITTCGLRGATPEGGWTNELRPDDIVHTLVAVHTDEGRVGVGSAFTTQALVDAALDVLRVHVIGRNPLEVERITETQHQASFWMGRGGALTQATSAIDIALWDIAGQVLGQPVGQLLGGRYRESVRPYASLLMQDPTPLRDELTGLVADGFTAFKIGWGPFGRVSDKLDEAIVAAARDAVGPEALLAIDAGGSEAFFPGDLRWAKRTAEMVAGYGVAWFEEALPPDALRDFVELRRSSPVPISGGEVLTRRQSFAPYIDAGAFDIVQPDTTKGGGLSESRRIGWAAEDRGLTLIPHGWNTAVGLAADLQLASALPRTDLVEYKTGAPYIDELVAAPWELHGGLLDIPVRPGLGIDLDRGALEQYGTHAGFADPR